MSLCSAFFDWKYVSICNSLSKKSTLFFKKRVTHCHTTMPSFSMADVRKRVTVDGYKVSDFEILWVSAWARSYKLKDTEENNVSFSSSFLNRACRGFFFTMPQGKGTLCFAGMHAVEGTPRVGIEMDQPVGLNNGTVKVSPVQCTHKNTNIFIRMEFNSQDWCSCWESHV